MQELIGYVHWRKLCAKKSEIYFQSENNSNVLYFRQGVVLQSWWLNSLSVMTRISDFATNIINKSNSITIQELKRKLQVSVADPGFPKVEAT